MVLRNKGRKCVHFIQKDAVFSAVFLTFTYLAEGLLDPWRLFGIVRCRAVNLDEWIVSNHRHVPAGYMLL